MPSLLFCHWKTALSFLLGFRYLHRRSNCGSFESLRVTASLPNAVLLPLIIFPGLCEYDILCEAFADAAGSPEEMMDQYTEQANVMIFLCQFAFCVHLFFMSQHAILGSSSNTQDVQETRENTSTTGDIKIADNVKTSQPPPSFNLRRRRFRTLLKSESI